MCDPAPDPPHVAAAPPAACVGPAAVPSPSSGPVQPPDAGVDADAQLRLVVHLVPIGSVPDETMELTAKALREHAPVDPIIEPRHGFPRHTRSSRPGAYKAIELLGWLDQLAIPRTGKIMGVTDADIVTPKGKHPIWGILGMGSIDGRCSVISTYRMERKWERGGAPPGLVRERLWKIAIHELGHTLGLDHCPKVGCIMEDGHGTVKTVDRDTALCDDCATRFADALRESASR